MPTIHKFDVSSLFHVALLWVTVFSMLRDSGRRLNIVVTILVACERLDEKGRFIDTVCEVKFYGASNA